MSTKSLSQAPYPVLTDTGNSYSLSDISVDIFSKLEQKKDICAVLEFSESCIRSQGLDLLGCYSKELMEHSRRVALLTIFLGMEYRMDIDRLLHMGVGAYLHDYGKSVIAEDILNKPDALTDNEYQLVQSHPSIGYRLLKPYGFSDKILSMVLQHHEKLDGSGYPTGESSLSIETQLITLSDMFDAIFHKRVYHESHTLEETITILEESKGINLIALDILKRGTTRICKEVS